MGGLLEKPVTEKNPEDSENDLAKWGLCSMQGHRRTQEDTHITKLIDQADGKQGMLCCVFDGHGGDEVSKHVEAKFVETFMETEQFKAGKFGEAMKETFRLLDEQVKGEEFGKDKGCTSCCVYFNKEMIYCASAGDSRGVLRRGRDVIALSEDHKPGDDDEMDRIERANHWVDEDFQNRIDGELAVSRSIGDHKYKNQEKKTWDLQAVTACPDVREWPRDPQDKWFVNACDGIWDCVKNEEFVKKFESNMNNAEKISDAIGPILDGNLPVELERKSLGTDNMTCMVVYMK